jgi:hypothetical protein
VVSAECKAQEVLAPMDEENSSAGASSLPSLLFFLPSPLIFSFSEAAVAMGCTLESSRRLECGLCSYPSYSSLPYVLFNLQFLALFMSTKLTQGIICKEPKRVAIQTTSIKYFSPRGSQWNVQPGGCQFLYN